MTDSKSHFYDFSRWENEGFFSENILLGTIAEDVRRCQSERAMLEYDLEFIAQRARQLGMFNTVQYHRLPTTNGWLEIMTTPMGHSVESEDDRESLRVTQNIKSTRMTFPIEVSVEDFVLNLSNHSLGAACAKAIIADVEQLPQATAPVIWQVEGEQMELFCSKEYSVPSPEYLGNEADFEAINAQRQEAALLQAILNTLSREVSLEEETPYSET